MMHKGLDGQPDGICLFALCLYIKFEIIRFYKQREFSLRFT